MPSKITHDWVCCVNRWRMSAPCDEISGRWGRNVITSCKLLVKETGSRKSRASLHILCQAPSSHFESSQFFNETLSPSDSCHFHSNRKSLVVVNRLECNNKLLAKPFPALHDIRSQQSHWHSRLTVAKRKKKKTLKIFSLDHLSQHMQPCETLPVAAAPRVSCHNEGVMSSCDSRPDPTRPSSSQRCIHPVRLWQNNTTAVTEVLCALNKLFMKNIWQAKINILIPCPASAKAEF